MDVIAELLPSSYLAKPENTAKDRKNKHQVKQKAQKQSADHEQSEQVAELTADWDQVERRSGEDRRQQKKHRGRWLDSRISPDRRKENVPQNLKICI